MTIHEESTRTRNPERTKRAVLDAAERLFAERGFVGTSMRDIADASGVSQPLIQYHFDHKDGLYAAALRRAVEAYAARFPEAAHVTDQPLDVACEMQRLFTFLQENQLQVRMIGWARLEGKHELVTGCESLRRAMVQRIECAQQQGRVRSDIKAASLGVMLEGLLFSWFENRSLNARLFPEGIDDNVFLRSAIALFERGVSTSTN
jgi:TetR/AcrR family transcriptional regulator